MERLDTLQISQQSKTNPLVKFILILIISIYFFLTPSVFKVYFIVLIGFIYYNTQSFQFQISKPRYKMLLLFTSIILAVQILTVQTGEKFFYLVPKISTIGPFLPIYEKGLYNGLLLVGRFWGVIIISWIFIDSTNPFNFAHSLTRIKVPYRIAYSLSLALRFTPILSQELNIIRGAQQSRGLNTNPSTLKGAYNNLKYTLLPLISSTLNRIKDITISMDGRGFGIYKDRTMLNEVPFTKVDFTKILGIIVFLIGLTYL